MGSSRHSSASLNRRCRGGLAATRSPSPPGISRGSTRFGDFRRHTEQRGFRRQHRVGGFLQLLHQRGATRVILRTNRTEYEPACQVVGRRFHGLQVLGLICTCRTSTWVSHAITSSSPLSWLAINLTTPRAFCYCSTSPDPIQSVHSRSDGRTLPAWPPPLVGPTCSEPTIAVPLLPPPGSRLALKPRRHSSSCSSPPHHPSPSSALGLTSRPRQPRRRQSFRSRRRRDPLFGQVQPFAHASSPSLARLDHQQQFQGFRFSSCS